MISSTFETRNLLDGRFVPVTGDKGYRIVNPATGALINEYRGSSAADVNAAVESAQRAFDQYSKTTPSQRQRLLLQLISAIEASMDSMTRLEVLETGKPIVACRWEYDLLLEHLRYFSGACRAMTTQAAGSYYPGRHSYVRREPYGVVGAIVPYNYPTLMAIVKIGTALATGNALVMKPPETCPLAMTRLVELVNRIFPPGLVNLVQGGGEVGAALVAHEDVDMIAFTGSSRTGTAIARAAADTMKPLQLELGAKTAVVIFADADINRVVKEVPGGAYYNAGQDCSASTRFIVERSRYDEVVTGLIEKTRSGFVMGDPLDKATNLGPLQSDGHRSRVMEMLGRRSKKAEIVVGGKVPDLPGYRFEPTVVVGVEVDDELAQEEIFGPVITVETFSDEEEAIRLANGTKYGLGSSVWTADGGRATRVSNALKVGAVWVNEAHALSPELPWGGRKRSGVGYELSLAALESFTHLKQVTTCIIPSESHTDSFLPST